MHYHPRDPYGEVSDELMCRLDAGIEAAEKYLAVFNASAEDGFIRFGLEELEDIKAGSKAVELWTGDSTVLESVFTADVPAHGAKVYKI